MLRLSRHNLFGPVADSSEHYLVNVLSGEAELLSAAEAQAYQALVAAQGQAAAPANPAGPGQEPVVAGLRPAAVSGVDAIGHGPALDLEALAAKGFLVQPAEEARRFKERYLRFTEQREADEVQLFVVPGYGCNFACDYCYQAEYQAPPNGSLDQVVPALFAHIDRAFAGRRVYLTLFGGEPLLPDAGSRRAVELIAANAAARGIDLAVVSNGYWLDLYVPLLARYGEPAVHPAEQEVSGAGTTSAGHDLAAAAGAAGAGPKGCARLREIQVTLDGPPASHDRRRPLRGAAPLERRGTFDRIAAGIDAALAAGLPINLRVVVDRDNLAALPELARLAVARGWAGHPLVKTQLGRNYELHGCQSGAQRLYSRLELFQDLYRLARQHPEVLALHRPAFSLARFLFDQGRLPDPLFDACPGCKTEWAFDLTGRIYACTATVGKPGEELGSFWPAVRLDEAAVARWQDRDVLAIAACRECPLALACGGGCAAVARRATGDLHAPDCRPVVELLGLGIGLYGPRPGASQEDASGPAAGPAPGAGPR